ncbi:methylmalonyl Co-A mutase-associated GTPase MeaB [Nakamurella lactea]|uniref:methylmalonyl Co-A mutase-associated GTPase MeaB n=1 Tax=Nakamurella lactea TaxID=459515 RepID=UPI00040BD700|nr:methylmalonyl Co-A mutase-associated GTPase MeaB [Nakamurella lactea]
MTDQVQALADGVRQNRRAAVSRAITVVESTRADHRAMARELLSDLASAAGGARRIGISGVPGVGKSTFIEALGGRLTADGHRVGVLAVDPSSVRTGGSVLGDRTRMPKLTADPRAYVRPSPSSGTLGGVTRATAQAITVLEAAGHDVVLVETVGVGQSEIAVAGMVDTFLLLGLARTGDQLQGIKKGVLEIADVVAINKADGDRVVEATAAARELTGALHLVYGRGADWLPPVLTCSALTGDGIEKVWQACLRHADHLGADGLARKRSDQQLELAWALVTDELTQRLSRSPAVAGVRERIRRAVLAGELGAAQAADEILRAFDEGATE